jgi:hypothetical protein
VNIDALSYDIRASEIVHALHYVYVDDGDDRVDVWFRDTLDSTDQAILVDILNNHSGMPLPFTTTMSGTDSDFSRNLIINNEGEGIGISEEMPFHVKSYTTSLPHALDGENHFGVLIDSQIPDLITRDSELINASGILNTKIDNLDFYTTDEVDALISGTAAWDHDHDLRYIQIANQSVIDHGLISGLSDNDHPQYLLNTDFTIYSGTLQSQIDGKAPIIHTHDDRYYTETELNNGQLDTRYYTESEVNTISGNLVAQMITDHGMLSGRGDDDHTQYALVTGARAITGDQTFQQDVVVQGNLTVSGTQFIANVEIVQVEDNIMLLNNGEPGAGVTERYAGIEIERGSSTNYLAVFDENSDSFYVGISGSLQPVATREESPISSGVALWNDTLKRFDTISSSVIHNRSHTITSTADHTAGNNKVFYSNGSGQVQELSLGVSGTMLVSTGTTLAPTFVPPGDILDYELATSCLSAGANFYTNPAATWLDVTFDVIQYQNNTAIVERHATLTDRITIKKSGVFLIQYCAPVYCPVVERVDVRVRKNDTTIISGSVSYLNDSMTQQVANQFSCYLNANDFITLQVMGASTGDYLADTSTINVVKLTAAKGDKGDTGTPGLPGTGSTVNASKDGTTASGSPFSNFNFQNMTVASGTVSGTVDVQNIFGSYFYESSSETDSSTTATTWSTKTSITTTTLPVGKYRIGWTYNMYGASTSVSPQGRVLLNGTDTIHAYLYEPKDASTNEQDAVGGFYYHTLATAGTVTVALQYATETAGSSMTIRRARLEFWRVS